MQTLFNSPALGGGQRGGILENEIENETALATGLLLLHNCIGEKNPQKTGQSFHLNVEV